jgi:hypothetical protein
MKAPVTRLADCQYLLVSQRNDTLTHFAAHGEQCSHDALNRSLRGERITPRLGWDNVRGQLGLTPRGSGLFDDTVLAKHGSFAIAWVRRQSSGNANAVLKGMGVVTCVYVNPETDPCWLRDYRMYEPDGDGTSKREHVHEMLSPIVYQKALPFQAVLMDPWYATKELMLSIELFKKFSYCPLQDNRQGEDSGDRQPSRRVDARDGSADEREYGKGSKIKGFPKAHKVQLCRGVVSTHRTDSMVTNELTQHATEATQEACGFRWTMEQWHRAGQQVTGRERGQCRTARMQRHPIGCAFLVWGRLKELATQTGRTVDQRKHGLLDDYLIQQLKKPSLQMVLA